MTRLTLVLAAASAVALPVLFFYPSSATPTRKTLTAHTGASPTQPLSVAARLDRNLFRHAGESTTLTVDLANRGQTPLTVPAMEIQAPAMSFILRHGCDLPPRLSSMLPPGGSCSVAYTLTPAEAYATVGVTLLIESAPENANPVVLSLSPIHIDLPSGAGYWNRFARRLALALKDLTVPLILVGIGAWFNRQQQQRENHRLETEKRLERERLSAEKEIEMKRMDEQRKQADRQQVRLLLLTKVTELAERHYLPIVSYANGILVEADKIERNEASASLDKLFFSLMLFLRRMVYLRTDRGAVFFQSRSGEQVVHLA